MEKDNNGYYTINLFNGKSNLNNHSYSSMEEALKKRFEKGPIPVFIQGSASQLTRRAGSDSHLCGTLLHPNFNETDMLITANFMPKGPQGQFADMALDMGRPTFAIRGHGKKRTDGKFDLVNLVSIDFVP